MSNTRHTFSCSSLAAHLWTPWKSIRDTSALSEPPEGASQSKLECSLFCFTLSFSCKEGKLGANLSIDQWLKCADYTRTDHHYLFIYFWQIQCGRSAILKRMKHWATLYLLVQLWPTRLKVILDISWCYVESHVYCGMKPLKRLVAEKIWKEVIDVDTRSHKTGLPVITSVIKEVSLLF